MKLFFSYSPDIGFSLHDSEDAARLAAQESIDEYAIAASGELWDDGVTEVCWGEVHETARVTSRLPAKEGDNPDADEIVTYGLMP